MLGLLSLAATTYACGPNFPNNLLSSGDEMLFTAPVANFRRELARLQLAPSRFDHIAATNGYAEQTFDAELADLTAALQQAKLTGLAAAPIITAHRKNREKLQKFLDEHQAWEAQAWLDTAEHATEKRGPEPDFPTFENPEGLPGEFADYFEGVVALKSVKPDRATALRAWERLLQRPASERKYKSTWTAFMLGKLWQEEDDAKAIGYFQMTRALAKKRFADSAGLTVAAIGWEARVELRLNHFQRALELYLEQFAAGDESAVQSLRIAANGALQEAGAELATLAATPNLRAVITAYLISDRIIVDYPTGLGPAIGPETAWLNAVEAADVKDAVALERMALLAYQNGDNEFAERWIKRAPASPTAQWLQAKLLLRAGKIPQAAKVLAQVARALPVVAPAELTNSAEFADALHMPRDSYETRRAREQVLGELGVLALSRGEFTQALDALLRAGFWQDAAYVAERVLTVNELKAYVDRDWPGPLTQPSTNAPTAAITEDSESSVAPVQLDTHAQQIRHLLARRLVRENRGREAQSYFPTDYQSRCAELLTALDSGWNETNSAEQRATALFTAAKIARADGMELLGTELGPDWFIYGGNFDWGLTWEGRGENRSSDKINRMTEAEFQRAARHSTDPEKRFHYRYHAAALAWEAAQLLPNNSEETARVLCTAGTWLKNRDPEAADVFYKALVRRCRQTTIGAQADRMRWFPVLDEQGQPKPYEPKTESLEAGEPDAPANEPNIGSEFFLAPVPDPPPQAESLYVIQHGDTLLKIAQAASELGLPITVRDLARANPHVNPSQLRVGQKIFIPAAPEESPAPTSDSEPNLGIAPDAPIPLPSAP